MIPRNFESERESFSEQKWNSGYIPLLFMSIDSRNQKNVERLAFLPIDHVVCTLDGPRGPNLSFAKET